MFFEPVGLLFGIVTMGIAHFGTSGEARYEAGCWSEMSWYRCHQENFANIHTVKYMQALREGHNPHARTPQARIVRLK